MSRPLTRILITGGSGFLGQYLLEAAPIGTEVLSLYHKRALPAMPNKQINLNLLEERALKTLLDEYEPDLVIHAAALSDVHVCEAHPEQSHQVNVLATQHLAIACQERGIRMVFTSTDLVFDGKQPPYSPADVTSPVSTYGRHKVEAERVIQQVYPEATIARLPVMYGWPKVWRKNLLSALVQQLVEGKTAYLFTDEYRSIAHAADVAKGLYLVADHPGRLFHLGGPAPVSRYAFGETVRQLLDVSPALIVGRQQAAVDLPAPRPRDVTLDSSAAAAIGFRPAAITTVLPKLAPALQAWYAQRNNNG